MTDPDDGGHTGDSFGTCARDRFLSLCLLSRYSTYARLLRFSHALIRKDTNGDGEIDAVGYSLSGNPDEIDYIGFVDPETGLVEDIVPFSSFEAKEKISTKEKEEDYSDVVDDEGPSSASASAMEGVREIPLVRVTSARAFAPSLSRPSPPPDANDRTCVRSLEGYERGR